MTRCASQSDKLNNVVCGRTDEQISSEIADAIQRRCLLIQALFDLGDPGFKLNLLAVKSIHIT